MQLERIFRRMIDVGRQAEWRDQATLDAQLAQRRSDYAALTGYEKRYYDLERLKNPFGCSRICAGAPDLDVRGMIVGINCTLEGVLYAERLRDKGRRIDAFLAHHGIPPSGDLYPDINNTHYNVLVDFGVPEDTARQIVERAIRDYTLRMGNEPTGFESHTDMALFNVHNPMDNLFALHTAQQIARERPATVAEIVELLLTMEEFAIDARYNVLPEIAVGGPGAKVGCIYFDVLGGICLNDEELAALLATGKVNTVVRLAYSNCIRICREAGVNLIFLPHNAHDNVGINLMLDQVVAEEPIDIVPTDGFYRVQRAPMTDFRWPKPATIPTRRSAGNG